MAQFMALNHAFSTTTGINAGTSYATGAKVAIQLQVPSGRRIKIIEYSVSMDNTSANTPARVELVQASAASTMSTAHTTSTVLPMGSETQTTGLTFGATTNTGYGNGSITTNTTQKYFDSQFIPPTGQFVKQWPLGREPMCDSSGCYVQLRINTSTTANVVAYIVWEEY